ncbi:MAG: transporter substrate-binding domain-containing protein [Desulfobacterales bacterium]
MQKPVTSRFTRLNPFGRAITYRVQEGKIDMMLNMTITEETEILMNFIRPQLDETIVLVVRKDSDFAITSMIQSQPKSIGWNGEGYMERVLRKNGQWMKS